MIEDAILMWLLGQMLLLVINLIGLRIPILSFVGIIGCILLAVPTMEAFAEYYFIALILILTNIVIPVLGIQEYRRHK